MPKTSKAKSNYHIKMAGNGHDSLSKPIINKRYSKMIIFSFIIIILCCSLNTYRRNETWKGRITLCTDCVLKSPHKARPHNNLGSIYDKKDMLDEAISEYKKALAINPNYEEALYNLGNIYAKKGMLDKAILEYKKALSINPNSAKVYNNLGLAYTGKDMLDEAVFEYKKALAINPNFIEVHNNLGFAYHYKRMRGEAISE